jgi:hypothetical protein
MTNEERQPALPQLRSMLGKAVSEKIANEGAGRRSHRIRGRRAPLRARLLVPLAVMATLGALAVGAGAFGLIPVAPQLSSEESGVKPGVMPGEVQILEGPNGEKVEVEVSPCIKSDPRGYSNAELNDPEWCFHPPHTGDPAPELHTGPQGSISGRSYTRGPAGAWHHGPTWQVEPK